MKSSATSPDRDASRALIREILVAAGAVPRDVDWMTASCPSAREARRYAARARIATLESELRAMAHGRACRHAVEVERDAVEDALAIELRAEIDGLRATELQP